MVPTGPCCVPTATGSPSEFVRLGVLRNGAKKMVSLQSNSMPFSHQDVTCVLGAPGPRAPLHLRFHHCLFLHKLSVGVRGRSCGPRHWPVCRGCPLVDSDGAHAHRRPRSHACARLTRTEISHGVYKHFVYLSLDNLNNAKVLRRLKREFTFILECKVVVFFLRERGKLLNDFCF